MKSEPSPDKCRHIKRNTLSKESNDAHVEHSYTSGGQPATHAKREYDPSNATAQEVPSQGVSPVRKTMQNKTQQVDNTTECRLKDQV